MSRLDAKPLSDTERDANATAGLHEAMHETRIPSPIFFTHNIFPWVSTLIAIRPNGELPYLSRAFSEHYIKRLYELRTNDNCSLTKVGCRNAPAVRPIVRMPPIRRVQPTDDWSDTYFSCELHHVCVMSGQRANSELHQQIIRPNPRYAITEVACLKFEALRKSDLISNSGSAAP
jgi:hypothetical protein